MIKRLTILLSFSCSIAAAQERLTLQDAINRALQYNFDVRIADAAAKQAATNNTPGNAGMLPNIGFSGSLGGSAYNTHNQLATGGTQDNPSAETYNYSLGATLGWTLFDGGRMFIVKKQLDIQELIGSEQFRLQLQATVSRTIQVYAQVVWQQKQLVAVDTALALSQLRMDLSRLKFETGASPKTDFLQATVDHNARRSDSLAQEANITQSFDSLNVLMGTDLSNTYVLDDNLELNTSLQPIDRQLLQDVNLSVSIYKHSAAASKLNEGVARSYRLPTLGINGGYYYNYTRSATGFLLSGRSYGPSGTASLNIPIFNGGNINRQIKVAALQTMRDELLYEKQQSIINNHYRTAWRDYELYVASYKLQFDNIKYAKENVDVQEARFRVGVGTTLEVREAENSYIQALIAFYTAAYNLKVSETIVLELENKLVK